MLSYLTITNIAVIRQLELNISSGLTVLTGETGAGKSILLDALGLCLGGRADLTLIRSGAEQAVVSSEFDITTPNSELTALLLASGISFDRFLVLRRQLQRDGRNRAWINDIPVNLRTLTRVGAFLLEIVGQFAQMELFATKQPQAILDRFGNHQELLDQIAQQYDLVQDLLKKFLVAKNQADQRDAEIKQLRETVAELQEYQLIPGEIDELTGQRKRLQLGEKLQQLADQLQQLLLPEPGMAERLRLAIRQMQTLGDALDPAGIQVVQKLSALKLELEEVLAEFNGWLAEITHDPRQLEQINERFFALKSLARKYQQNPNDLLTFLQQCEQRLAQEQEVETLALLQQQLAQAQQRLEQLITELHRLRQTAAARLTAAVTAEFPALHLAQAKLEARFAIQVIAEPATKWNRDGGDKVSFLFSANPGTELQPIAAVASGGELSRFLLALKLVLADQEQPTALIFDEIDMAVGGATAAAIGERLGKLARKSQVLVISHTPQVAVYADHHLKVAKQAGADQSTTNVLDISSYSLRLEEIARMLSGQKITDQARAAAAQLLDKSATLNPL